MTRYIRTNVYLTETQKTQLKQEATKQGLKPAELTRRIVDTYLKRRGYNG